MISSIELCSVPADYGHGANDGAYYPVGLLTLGSYMRRAFPSLLISIVDLHHDPDFLPHADLVGISASSTLNYRNVLALAQRAKESGAKVLLGGPHATQLPEQVLRNREGLIDFLIRGNGEFPLAALLTAINNGSDLAAVPSLSWRNAGGEIIHNSHVSSVWRYDNFLPLEMSLLSCGLQPYWDKFRSRIDPSIDAAFVVFTHFGCGYREKMQGHAATARRPMSWCSYCSLNDPLSTRTGSRIVSEVLELLRAGEVSPGSRVLLKCYGDNVGTQHKMLGSLAEEIERCKEWRDYQIAWTFYAQSSRISPELSKLLSRVGTENLFIGFDSADDDVQRLNGLGTSVGSHRRAVQLCKENHIKIQAGFVLGCAGETQTSLDRTLAFAEELSQQKALERINTAMLVIIPGSPAYSLLCEREPWVKTLDDLPTEELQWYWVKHFCPRLGKNPSDGLAILIRAANELNALLEHAAHASMGFISDRLAAHSDLAGGAG